MEAPPSILDREGPRPAVFEEDRTAGVVLPLVALVLLLAFAGWLLFLLARSGFASDAVAGRARGALQCAPGQCATDLLSGAKSCPAAGGLAAVDPARAVCNSAGACDNPITPYAQRADGSTDASGACEPGTQCPCLRAPRCAEYVASAFTPASGNPYASLEGQRLSFPQVPPDPLPAAAFCSAPASWLPLASPGCSFISSPSVSYNELVACMGLPVCGAASSSPCLQGTLAFLASDPDALTQSNFATYQLACVRGSPCPCGLVAVFDTSFGGVVCRSLPAGPAG